VARDDEGMPIGLVLAQLPLAVMVKSDDEKSPKTARLLSIFVAPDLRGGGIATRLMSALDDELRRRGVVGL